MTFISLSLILFKFDGKIFYKRFVRISLYVLHIDGRWTRGYDILDESIKREFF